jgi:hypothetical protein
MKSTAEAFKLLTQKASHTDIKIIHTKIDRILAKVIKTYHNHIKKLQITTLFLFPIFSHKIPVGISKNNFTKAEIVNINPTVVKENQSLLTKYKDS